jgi:dTDP-4-dehydrorhamnose reductase
MIIGVTGHRGRLGQELIRRGCIPIKADVTNFKQLGDVIRQVTPDVVVHCASRTNVDMCESAAISTAKINMGGTLELTQVFDGKIVYISTDYIFDGENGPYSEDDKPNPISIYGWSKLGGEIVIRNTHNPNHLIVRTTVLFDGKTNNFVTKVIEQLLLYQTIPLPDTLIGSPTYVPHLAEAILKAIEMDLSGTINISGDLVISRYRFGQKIAELLNISPKRIISGPVTGQAPRPLNAGLKIDKAKSFCLPIYDPMIGVKKVIYALEKMATR